MRRNLSSATLPFPPEQRRRAATMPLTAHLHAGGAGICRPASRESRAVVGAGRRYPYHRAPIGLGGVGLQLSARPQSWACSSSIGALGSASTEQSASPGSSAPKGTSTPFSQFCWRVLEEEAPREALRVLEDAHGLDPNMLLLCVWLPLGPGARPIVHADLPAFAREGDRWHRRVRSRAVHLRAVVAGNAPPSRPEVAAAAEALEAQIRQVEEGAAGIERAALYAVAEGMDWSAPPPLPPAPEAGAGDEGSSSSSEAAGRDKDAGAGEATEGSTPPPPAATGEGGNDYEEDAAPSEAAPEVEAGEEAGAPAATPTSLYYDELSAGEGAPWRVAACNLRLYLEYAGLRATEVECARVEALLAAVYPEAATGKELLELVVPATRRARKQPPEERNRRYRRAVEELERATSEWKEAAAGAKSARKRMVKARLEHSQSRKTVRQEWR
mmetsp:Transcript_51827/g.165468  ORF Transcript_51827/g.165468 Transcript_51827/m.165468 type:complete len:443 (+) Transcript_51827:179-1507(+)